MVFMLLCCAEPQPPDGKSSGVETVLEETAPDTGSEEEGGTGEGTERVSIEFTTTVTTAERADESNSFVTAVVDAPGATFTVTGFAIQNLPIGAAGAGRIVASGVTPATVSLSPGFYCVEFENTLEAGTPYVSDRTCFHAVNGNTINGELCVELRSDWICEDMWGEEGTPETYYTTHDIVMESCQTELYGITWGGQPATFDGHFASFTLGEYTATGAVDENGTSIEWFVDFGVDYWTTCAMMY